MRDGGWLTAAAQREVGLGFVAGEERGSQRRGREWGGLPYREQPGAIRSRMQIRRGEVGPGTLQV